MKTFCKIILFVVVLVCGFVAGYCTGQKKLSHNYYEVKTELIKAQGAALDEADHVMDQNELFDTDGSDAMVKYLDLAHKVDSLYQLEE